MAKTLQLFKAVLSLSNQVCKILFYCPDSTDSEVIYQNLCYIRRKECRQCRSEMDIFDSKQTGALTLEASVMFDYDQAELTDSGKQALEQILPIYCKVLLQDDYKDYLAEIIIDGYTDTDGDYSYNLQLSQQRSLAVAQYLINIQGNFLSDEQSQELEKYLTVNGHSMANPVLDADGNVDKDASRRVEVKFRLKDEEMIDELNQLLAGTASQSDTADQTDAENTENN